MRELYHALAEVKVGDAIARQAQALHALTGHQRRGVGNIIARKIDVCKVRAAVERSNARDCVFAGLQRIQPGSTGKCVKAFYLVAGDLQAEQRLG